MATELPDKTKVSGDSVTEGDFSYAMSQLIDHLQDINAQIKAITGEDAWSVTPTTNLKEAVASTNSRIIDGGSASSTYVITAFDGGGANG